jgi:hypothetical protein
MPITSSKIKYGTRSIVHFEAPEQTLRLRLVSGPADKKFFLIIGTAPTPTVLKFSTKFSTVYLTDTGNRRIAPARRSRAGFRKFSRKKIHASRAHGAPAGVRQFTLWIQIADVAPARTQSCDRKSKFGLRYRIKLIDLYTVTKSEFWFSIIPPRTRGINIRSFFYSSLQYINLGTAHTNVILNLVLYGSAYSQ